MSPQHASTQLRLLLVSLIAILGVGPTAAHALDDYVLGSVGNGFMADFDQVRQPGPMVFDGQQFYPLPPGLPGNGSMYCVPTASIDVMAYLANHGYPDALPGGPLNWQSQDHYDLVTAAIFDMGTLMETDPVLGTLGKGRWGTQEWLDTRVGPDLFIVDRKSAKFSYGPNAYELAQAGHAGQLVMMNVGWYEEVPGGKWIRRGGHQTVITGVYQNDGFFLDGCQVRFRDPSGGGDSQTQSTFSNDTKTIDYVSGQFSNSSDPVSYSNRTMARLIGYGGGSNQGFLHGIYTVTPVFGIGSNGLQLDILNPNPINPGPFPIVQGYVGNGGISIADFAIHPSKTRVYYTVRNAAGGIVPEVRCLDRVSGESTVVVVGVAPSALVFDGGQRLYAVEGSCVHAYDPSATAPVATQCMPAPLSAAAHDDANDLVLAVSSATHTLYVMDENLQNVVELPLPSTFDLSGELSMTTNPKTGDLWLKGSNSDTVHQLRLVPGTATCGDTYCPQLVDVGSFSDPELVGGTGIECNGSDQVFWVKDGIVRVHAPDAAGGWSETTNSPFAGMASDGKFRLARAADNTDPEEDTDPSNVNVLPDTVVGFQRGNCNGDAAYNIADAIATLSFLFAAADVPACLDACDANDDGGIDIGDGIYTLTALFSGGASPPAPFADCGEDPTADDLDCASFDCP